MGTNFFVSRKSAGDRVTNKFVQTAHTHKADRAGVTGNIVVKLKDKKTND